LPLKVFKSKAVKVQLLSKW